MIYRKNSKPEGNETMSLDTADTIIFRSLFRWSALAIACLMAASATCSLSDDRKKERLAETEAAEARAKADEARANADRMAAQAEVEKAYTERIRIERGKGDAGP